MELYYRSQNAQKDIQTLRDITNMAYSCITNDQEKNININIEEIHEIHPTGNIGVLGKQPLKDFPNKNNK